MAKLKNTIDFSKFRTGITKRIDGMSVGFNDPDTWISTGNYVLNYLISGDFNKGVPLGKVTMFAGQSGSAKSFISSGNIVREAQKQGVQVILIDTEGALDAQWLERLGVDTDEDKLFKVNMSMLDDTALLISDFMKNYKSEFGGMEPTERPKVLFVLDSLGMLLTPTEVNQFEKGDMKGDMGRKAKALKMLIANCVNMFDSYNVGMVCTNHTYQSQDMFNPDDVVSGGCLTDIHSILKTNGDVVNISEVKIGDNVKTLNGGNIVTDLFFYDDKEVFEIELENGEILQGTGNHKFLIFNEHGDKVWKQISDLDIDDEILRISEMVEA